VKVPFLDLKAQYASIKAEIDDAIQRVIDSCAFAGGPFVDKFEAEWAAYCGVPHAIGVANGTEALWLALIALGIGRGDEVITVPNTFIATAEAITYSGATPVFVDTDPEYYTMDPRLLEAAITPRTKAVIPVHLFGQMADMDAILALAKRHDLFVIEDACQAHGASYNEAKAGSLGDAAAFSFYPGKNLGAYGEAGAVTTRDADLARKIRMLRDHGQSKKYYHDVIGWNGRMDGIQGAILSVKLRHLDGWCDARRSRASLYHELLSGTGVTLPGEDPRCRHVYHLYAIQVEERDRVMAALSELGIGTGIHYPVIVPDQTCYQGHAQPHDVSVSRKDSTRLLSLPMYPELADSQVREVAAALRSLILA
jgi:dTDP-4-amino-4,6-dideoxygalactose transaminase